MKKNFHAPWQDTMPEIQFIMLSSIHPYNILLFFIKLTGAVLSIYSVAEPGGGGQQALAPFKIWSTILFYIQLSE